MPEPLPVRIADALAALIPLADGVTRDTTATQPAQALPGRLYCYPRQLAPQRLTEDQSALSGRPGWADPTMRLRLVYTQAARGEGHSTAGKDREVSVALGEAVDAIVAAVEANKRTTLWWDAYIEAIAYDVVRGPKARGHGVDVALRLNDPLPEGDYGSP